MPPLFGAIAPFYTPSVILSPLRGSGHRASIRGSMLVPQLFFLPGVAATGIGKFHLDRCASDLNPPGFGGFRLWRQFVEYD